jgi:hypothetical protein
MRLCTCRAPCEHKQRQAHAVSQCCTAGDTTGKGPRTANHSRPLQTRSSGCAPGEHLQQQEGHTGYVTAAQRAAQQAVQYGTVQYSTSEKWPLQRRPSGCAPAGHPADRTTVQYIRQNSTVQYNTVQCSSILDCDA